MRIITLTERPKFLAPYKKLVRGIHVGGCLFDATEADDGMEDAIAHAHCLPGRFGHICVLNRFYARSRMLILHEVAHLLAPYPAGHTDAWREIVLAIGGTLKRHCLCDNGRSQAVYMRSYMKIPRESQVLKNAAVAREDLRLTIVETAAKLKLLRI